MSTFSLDKLVAKSGEQARNPATRKTKVDP
jgi:hypothetical protein